MPHHVLPILACVALVLSIGCSQPGIESERSEDANQTEPVSQDSPGPQESKPSKDLADVEPEDLKVPGQVPVESDLPGGKSAKPVAMNPPFPKAGDSEWVLDFYVFGGIQGRTDRLRISSKGEVILRQWDKVSKRRPLTAEEAEELADLKKNYRSERRQGDDGPVPDGMSTGVFFAGEGKAGGLAKITRFAETIIQPEIYKRSKE